VRVIPPCNFILQKSKRAKPFVVHADKLKRFHGVPPVSWLTTTSTPGAAIVSPTLHEMRTTTTPSEPELGLGYPGVSSPGSTCSQSRHQLFHSTEGREVQRPPADTVPLSASQRREPEQGSGDGEEYEQVSADGRPHQNWDGTHTVTHEAVSRRPSNIRRRPSYLNDYCCRCRMDKIDNRWKRPYRCQVAGCVETPKGTSGFHRHYRRRHHDVSPTTVQRHLREAGRSPAPAADVRAVTSAAGDDRSTLAADIPVGPAADMDLRQLVSSVTITAFRGAVDTIMTDGPEVSVEAMVNRLRKPPVQLDHDNAMVMVATARRAVRILANRVLSSLDAVQSSLPRGLKSLRGQLVGWAERPRLDDEPEGEDGSIAGDVKERGEDSPKPASSEKSDGSDSGGDSDDGSGTSSDDTPHDSSDDAKTRREPKQRPADQDSKVVVDNKGDGEGAGALTQLRDTVLRQEEALKQLASQLSQQADASQRRRKRRRSSKIRGRPSAVDRGQGHRSPVPLQFVELAEPGGRSGEESPVLKRRSDNKVERPTSTGVQAGSLQSTGPPRAPCPQQQRDVNNADYDRRCNTSGRSGGNRDDHYAAVTDRGRAYHVDRHEPGRREDDRDRCDRANPRLYDRNDRQRQDAQSSERSDHRSTDASQGIRPGESYRPRPDDRRRSDYDGPRGDWRDRR